MDGEYIDRKYRKSFAAGRWHGFSVCYKETDLWIGVDRASWNEDIPSFASSYVQSLRHEMDSWIASHAEYAASLVPVECTDDAPLIFRQMAEVAFHSGIGPMSAVAGAVAAFTGRAIKERFGVVEVLVENGGDIYADIATDMDVSAAYRYRSRQLSIVKNSFSLSNHTASWHAPLVLHATRRM